MIKYNNEKFSGERALYNLENLSIDKCEFFDGESPLKECKNITINDSVFKYRYPIWYTNNVKIYNTNFIDDTRAGFWYCKNIRLKNCEFTSPKHFRRCNKVYFENVTLSNSSELFWYCKNISLEHVSVEGEYFALHSSNIIIKDFKLKGKYSFDTTKNVIIENAIIDTKDAFWNSENVVVKNSVIKGEYLGWNSKNITFIDCEIESLQGLCYIDGLKLINCKLVNTNLCFELCSNIDATINSHIDSVKNPISGTIKAMSIGEIIFDSNKVDKNNTNIIVGK